MKAFGYDVTDFIPCEICQAEAVDLHHIDARGMGGDPKGEKDNIQNLMALCRRCHSEYGDKKAYKSKLKEIHEIHLMNAGQ